MTAHSSSPKNRPSLAHPGVMLATWFGAGYLPKAPGTWGSIGALPFAWVIVDIFGVQGLFAACVFVFFIGLWASAVYMRLSGSHDPGPVVIDEVVGQWIVLLIAPHNIWAYAIGFVLFRLFDITKPWPISWADKRIGGAMGVMLDDVLAGCAGLGVMYMLQFANLPFVEM